jgi:hypothetical protein
MPKFRRLLVVVNYGPMEPIGAILLHDLDRLDIRAETMSRATLASLLALCPSLRHLSLHTRCHPETVSLDGQHSHSAGATSPEPLPPRLCSSCPRFRRTRTHATFGFPASIMGRSNFWWETNDFRVGTADHHEEVVPKHFPQLRQLAVGTWRAG